MIGNDDIVKRDVELISDASRVSFFPLAVKEGKVQK